ncbi:MAG TPA: hypothetical protein VIF83_01790 [Gemmatimonadaceae bacterium]|jgi:hypothetical protein
MPPEVIIVPAIFAIPAFVLIFRMLIKHKEKMANVSPPADLRAIDERLTRMEQSIDAMAIEMERVGEGQRFVTKLLAERAPERLPSASDR